MSSPSIQVRCNQQRDGFGLSLDLELPGEGVSVVLGPSGAGKTSLLRVLAGLDNLPGATVSFNGTDWQQGNAFLPTEKRRLGYVFQESGLFPHLSVEQNLNYGLKRLDCLSAGHQSHLSDLIELLDLRALLERMPETLSGGERQRVAIARALAAQPQLLLMDEPLSGIDVTRRSELMPYLQRLTRSSNIPVVYVTHDLPEAARLAGHLVYMEAGSVVASGSPAELMTRLDLPLARIDAAAAVVNAKLEERDDQYQLSRLSFAGGELWVNGLLEAAATDESVRVQIAARDVSLTNEHQTGTSILNIIPVTVTGIEPDGDAQLLVSLDAGGIALLSRITRRSANELDLTSGKRVFAQIKSAAVLI